MSDETKQLGIGMAAIVIVSTIAALGFSRCEGQKQETLRQCLQTARPALECSAMTFGGGAR